MLKDGEVTLGGLRLEPARMGTGFIINLFVTLLLLIDGVALGLLLFYGELMNI